MRLKYFSSISNVAWRRPAASTGGLSVMRLSCDLCVCREAWPVTLSQYLASWKAWPILVPIEKADPSDLFGVWRELWSVPQRNWSGILNWSDWLKKWALLPSASEAIMMMTEKYILIQLLILLFSIDVTFQWSIIQYEMKYILFYFSDILILNAISVVIVGILWWWLIFRWLMMEIPSISIHLYSIDYSGILQYSIMTVWPDILMTFSWPVIFFWRRREVFGLKYFID